MTSSRTSFLGRPPLGVLAVLALLVGALPARAQWQPRGRTTGTASTIVVQKWSAAQKRVVVGTPGAGVFAFDGTTFRPKSAGLTNTDITGLAMDPADGTLNTGWASTKQGVFRTTDGGNSWSDFSSAELPPSAQDTTDIAVTDDGIDAWLWISTTISGIWRRPLRWNVAPPILTWQEFDGGIPGARKSVTALAALSASGYAMLLATTSKNTLIEPGTDAGVYRWKNGETGWTSLTLNAPGSLTGHSYQTVSLAKTGATVTAFVGSDCSGAPTCTGYLFYSGDAWGSLQMAAACNNGWTGTSFFSVHHAYDPFSGAFYGATGTNNGLYILNDPGGATPCLGNGLRYAQKWNGPAGALRVAIDPVPPGAGGALDELFIGAPGRGFFHGPPDDPSNGDFLRYDQNISDYNVKQVLFSPGFNGICEFAGGGDSTVLAVSGTGGVYKSVDDNLTAPSAPCNYDGKVYFTRMNYFPNASDTANITVAAFAPSYLETGTVGSASPVRNYQNTLFVGTSGQGVLRSDDGAVSWGQRNGAGTAATSLPDNAEVTSLVVAPGKQTPIDRILFAAIRNVLPDVTNANALIFLSTDAAASWKPLTALPRSGSPAATPYRVSAMALPSTFNSDPTQPDPTGTRSIYVATEVGLFKGTGINLATGAVTWTFLDFDSTQSPDPPITTLALSPAFDETCTTCGANPAKCLVLLGTNGQGVYRSLTKGSVSTNTWTKINGMAGSSLPNPPNAIVNAIAIAPQFRDAAPKVDLAYVSVTDTTLPFSCGSVGPCEKLYFLENGLTLAPSSIAWIPRPLPSNAQLDTGQPRTMSLAISPCFDGTIAPCTIVHSKSDQVLAGTVESQIFTVDHFDPTNPGVRPPWLATAGFYSVPANIQTVALRPDKDNIVLAGTRDAGIFLSIDKGQSFRPWSQGLVNTAGQMVKRVFSLGFSTDRTELGRDEYKTVAGTDGYGLFTEPFLPSSIAPGWVQAQLWTAGGNVPFDCGKIKDIRFAESPIPDATPGNRQLQEFRATVIPVGADPVNPAPCPSQLTLRAVRSTRDISAIPDQWPDLGSLWYQDDTGLPGNGLQANSYEPNASATVAEGGTTEESRLRSENGKEPNTLPSAILIWGASGSGASSFSLAERDGKGATATGCGTGGVYYSAWKKSGSGSSWSRRNDDDGFHDLPCADTSYQSVLTVSGTEALLGSSNAGVWITRDDGATWWQSNEGLGGTSLDVRSFTSTTSGSIVAALAGATNGGTFLSDSGGFAWVPFNTGLDASQLGTLNLTTDTSSGNTIYAAMSGDGVQAIDVGSYSGNPTAYFTALAAGDSCATKAARDPLCDGTTIRFCNRTAGKMTGVTWSWSFGDAGCSGGGCNVSTAEEPLHLFSNPGSYTVTLSATQGTGGMYTDSYSTTVTIRSRIDATIASATRSGSALTYNWSAPSGQSGWEVWGATNPTGAGRTQQASCAASCSGTATFTPAISGSTLYFKLKVNSSTDSCGSGYEW